MNVRKALVGVLAGSLLLAACGSSGGSGIQSQGTAGVGSSGKNTSSPKLKPQLLTLDALPTGWAVDNSSDESSGTAPKCLKNVKSTMRSDDRSEAEADFVKGTTFPQLSQQIADFGSDASAAQKFSAAVALVDACRDISFTVQGHKITGSIGAMSFQQVAPKTHAWNIVLSAEGITIGFYAAYVQKGAEVESIIYSDFGTPNLDEYTNFVKAAVAKMP
jgi:hypothetical protein